MAIDMGIKGSNVGDELSNGYGEIKIGMTFKNEDDAYNTYNCFAISKGFGVRKGQKFWRKEELAGCVFLCSCEGKSSVRKPCQEKKRERLEYRCGCNARVKFKIINGTWEIVDFNDDHSHPMVEEKQRHFISSARNLSPAMRQIINSLVDSGIGPKKAFRYLVKEAGGIENVGFIEQDVHNHQQSRRRSMIGSGDAQSLIDYFKSRQLADSNFFYTFELDEDGRLCNVFWRDGVSRLHYECFGDVMIFDTTYRTNKWNMVLAPFVGVNNHWKNIYFGCAFLHDETSNSFEWLFRSFLDSMGGKHPETIFTDQDHAMGVAISKVMPKTRHRLCEWHIEKNATQNIPHLLSKPNFSMYFNKLLWRCESESEFYMTWKKMIEEFDLEDNSWLRRLYDLREKWCPVFGWDAFSAGIKSTSRSENANKIFTEMSCKATTLMEFVIKYESKATDLCDMEAKDDFRMRGKPKLSVRECRILEHAAKIFTPDIFYKFQDEFLQCMSDWNVHVTTHENTEMYTIESGTNEKSHVVHFDQISRKITCSCHLFETMGWLCRHALRVLHVNLRFKSIPEGYILKRWTKGAKQGVNFEKYETKGNNTATSSLTIRLNSLLRESFSVMSMAVGDDATEKIATMYLDAARNEIAQYQKKIFSFEDVTNHLIITEKSLQDLTVKDPATKRRKGERNVRLKSSIEKRKTKKSRKENIVSQEAPQSTTLSTIPCYMQAELFNSGTSFTQLLGQVDHEVGGAEYV